MAFWGDYHTHTTYSRNGGKLHGKGSVFDNARAAARNGLKELAITDHGYGHVYGVKGEAAFAALKADCLKAQEETGVKIYAGLENNLNPKSGKNENIPPFINLTDGVLSELQIVQGGYHAFVGIPRLINNTAFWTRNVIFGFMPTKKLIAHNTEAYIRMIDEYPVDFIGHLNRGIIADAVAVAEYAHGKGVYIELNGRHRSLKKSEVKEMISRGVEFVCNSDAHNADNVGNMALGEQMIRECEIPLELVANWDRLPEFRSRNFKAARAGEICLR